MNVRIVDGSIVCRQCECQAPDVVEVPEGAHKALGVEASPALLREEDVIRAVKGGPVHVIKLRRDPKHVRDALQRVERAIN